MLTHPAVEVARNALAEFAHDFTAAAVLAHDEVAGVVMDNPTARFVVIVENRSGVWTAPGCILGGPRPARLREARTPDYRPLQRLSRKHTGMLDANGNRTDHVWFAVTGLAAEDATEISVVIDGTETREPIGEDGLAFAVARVPHGCDPEVYVHTQDGRRIAARH